ncbi:MAG: hypothetical protein JWR67_2732, partial [Mucilaginibacter sp.]|nr:hypothetical protein [Mucilaginibacter sp.]
MKKKPFYRFSGTIIIRLLVGIIFLLEGIQKILFPAMNAVGRFAKIGIPYPYFFGPFVGFTEIICSTLIIIGFYTRLASVPLLIVIITAILITKAPLFMEKSFWFA